MNVVGYLVTVNGIPMVVNPSAAIVTKRGRKQFWFYYNKKAMLAYETEKGWVA